MPWKLSWPTPQRGARVRAGGNRIGNEGFFFEPTVLTDVPRDARTKSRSPPGRADHRVQELRRGLSEANRLPYGLAAYAYARSTKTMVAIGADIKSGMVSINHHGVALPEVPFGGIKDSGYGSEGGYNRWIVPRLGLIA